MVWFLANSQKFSPNQENRNDGLTAMEELIMELKQLVFFLGGHDAEMVEIRRVLEERGENFVDAGLGWSASVESYKDEIDAALAAGSQPVLIELAGAEGIEGAIVVDHHGDRAGEPASIIQVLDLLGLEPNRWQQLIAANDAGFIPAMIEVGASAAEIAEIRALDRAAQGITPEQEAQAEEAIRNLQVADRLTVVHLTHSKTATVTDRLFGEYDQLLVLSGDGEVNFFGDGELCSHLQEKFQGWSGGSGLGKSGESAFWGGYPDHQEVEDFILNFLKN